MPHVSQPHMLLSPTFIAGKCASFARKRGLLVHFAGNPSLAYLVGRRGSYELISHLGNIVCLDHCHWDLFLVTQWVSSLQCWDHFISTHHAWQCGWSALTQTGVVSEPVHLCDCIERTGLMLFRKPISTSSSSQKVAELMIVAISSNSRTKHKELLERSDEVSTAWLAWFVLSLFSC